jgi:hypothetical protein
MHGLDVGDTTENYPTFLNFNSEKIRISGLDKLAEPVLINDRGFWLLYEFDSIKQWVIV